METGDSDGVGEPEAAQGRARELGESGIRRGSRSFQAVQCHPRRSPVRFLEAADRSHDPRALVALAKAAEVEAKREAMFRGEIVNPTERRAALHTALRDFYGKPVFVDGRDVVPEVIGTREKCWRSPRTCARAACAARSANR